MSDILKKYPKLEKTYEEMRGFDWEFAEYYPDKGLMLMRQNFSSCSEVFSYDYWVINKNGKIIPCADVDKWREKL